MLLVFFFSYSQYNFLRLPCFWHRGALWASNPSAQRSGTYKTTDVTTELTVELGMQQVTANTARTQCHRSRQSASWSLGSTKSAPKPVVHTHFHQRRASQQAAVVCTGWPTRRHPTRAAGSPRLPPPAAAVVTTSRCHRRRCHRRRHRLLSPPRATAPRAAVPRAAGHRPRLEKGGR